MKKKLLCVLLALAMVFALTVPVLAADVGSADPALTAARHLNQLGLFNGIGNNADGTPNFDLDRAPNRNEAVTMLVRLLGKEDEAKAGSWTTPFTDVKGWPTHYVGYAYEHGLTNGASKTTFGGDALVTASQYLTFVLRALGYSSGSDFQWRTAWTLTDELGITHGQYNENTTEFTRGDVVIISDSALSAKLKGSNQTLFEKLGLTEPKDVIGYPENGYAEGYLGDTMHTCFFDFTVNSAYTCQKFDGLTADSGYKFLVAEITIQNTTKYTQPMFFYDFQIQWDAQSGEDEDKAYGFPLYEKAAGGENGEITYTTVSDRQLPTAWDLGIREERTGLLLYMVPAGSKDYSISFLEVFSSDGGKEENGDVFFIYFNAKPGLAGYTFDVPAGFTVSADNERLWLAPNYPTDGSNINVTATDHDELFDAYTRETLEASVEALFALTLGKEVDVVSDSFERTTVGGLDAIRYRYHMNLFGTALRQEVVMVNCENMGYSFTFTQSGDADWNAAFEHTISSIRFVFE